MQITYSNYIFWKTKNLTKSGLSYVSVSWCYIYTT